MIGIASRELVGDFARELNALREVRALTWEELARRAGVSRTYLRDLAGERSGQGFPSEACVARIAGALEVDPDHFRLTRARVVLRSAKTIDAVYAKLTAPRS